MAARENLDTAMALLEENPDPARECVTSNRLAWLALLTGDQVLADSAVAVANKAVARCEDPEIRAATSITFGMWGYTPETFANMEAALGVVRSLGNQMIERELLNNLSDLVLASPNREELARGVAWGQESVDLSLVAGDLEGACYGANNRATALLLTGGDPGAAAAGLVRSMELGTRMSDVLVQVESLLRLAAAESARGDTDRARTLLSHWRHLSTLHGTGMTDSNQRVVDQFLPDLFATTEAREVTLADAVTHALESGGSAAARSRAP